MAEKWREELAEDGVDALTLSHANRLVAVELLRLLPTEGERLDAKTAITLLQSGGKDVDLAKPLASPLAEAARFWLFHHPAAHEAKLLSIAFDEYLVRKSCRRPATISEYRYKLGRFIKDHPEATVLDVTSDTIDHWLTNTIGREISNRKKYLRLLHGFFRFCRAMYRIPENPAAGVYLDSGESDQTDVEAYTVEETAGIMAEAAKHKQAPRIMPSLAIGFFAGLRPTEITGLDWSNVSIDQRTIRVTPATAKRRRQRFVTISENLAAWLAPYAKASGPVSPAPITFRRDRKEVLKAAKVERWLHDGLRHSYGTYHLAAYGDANKTAMEMGHRGNTDLVFQHYRKLVTKEEGLKYWEIKPEASC